MKERSFEELAQVIYGHGRSPAPAQPPVSPTPPVHQELPRAEESSPADPEDLEAEEPPAPAAARPASTRPARLFDLSPRVQAALEAEIDDLEVEAEEDQRRCERNRLLNLQWKGDKDGADM